MKVTRRLRITGQVQGVGFRIHALRKAGELGVAGWVRNRRDGSVEAVVHGTPEAVDAMVAWARLGPPSAAVQEVRVSEGSGEYASFEVRPTE